MLELGMLRSRVARRVFILLVLSAFTPIIITAALAFFQVSRVLNQQNEAMLWQLSKNYGMVLVDRLQQARAILETIAIAPADTRVNLFATVDFSRRGIESLVLITNTGEQQPLIKSRVLPVLPQPIAPITSGSQLFISHLPGQRPAIYLRLALDPQSSDAAALLAEISPEFLWGEAERLPLLTDVCVISARGQNLYCSRAVPPEVWQLNPLPDHRGTLRWHSMGEEYSAVYRELFLEPQFLYPHLKIVAFQQSALAWAPLSAFMHSFPALIILVLLLVLFLSLSQIRRILVPLEKLIDRIRLFARRQLSQPIIVNSQDEFDDLAEAFNSMSTQLERQFCALDTLAEVDRVIQTGVELDDLIQTVLEHAPSIVAADTGNIVLFDMQQPAQARVFFKNYAVQEHITASELSLPKQMGRAIPDTATLFCGIVEGVKTTELALLTGWNAAASLIAPIIQDKRTVGLLALGYGAPPEISPDDIRHIGDLADRIGVALASRAHSQQLNYQAHYDALTGLPNRPYFLELLDRAMRQSKEKDTLLAVLFIDLDRFKIVNDAMGHAAGDQLLEDAARRIENCLDTNSTAARLGGDEFTVLLSELPSANAVGAYAKKIIAALSQPFHLHGQEQFISASIGIAIYPSDGSSGEELLRHADTAMYHAKRNGRTTFQFFNQKMDTEMLERAQLERDLRQALAQEQFELVYQPKLDLHTQTITSAEALLRWQHPVRGHVSPAVFIPLAEELGLIDAIGDWVIAQSCRQLQHWQSEALKLQQLAVNVSSRQFKQPDFADRILSWLAAAELSPDRLELEITESLFMDERMDVATQLNRLRHYGVSIAIDDFGTGYSSLGYLQRFPVDTLKMDRSFIIDIPQNSRACMLVESVIQMGLNLGKTVVVEGIESTEQMAFIEQTHCSFGQGYFISRPLPAEEFADFVRSHNTASLAPPETSARALAVC